MPNIPHQVDMTPSISKVGKKWSSEEEVSASRPKSTGPPASYFKNRRSSLPTNTLSPRPRTSLSDVFTNHLSKGSSGDITAVQSLSLSTEKLSLEPAPFQRLKRTASLSKNCRALADLMKLRSEAISRLNEDSQVSDKKFPKINIQIPTTPNKEEAVNHRKEVRQFYNAIHFRFKTNPKKMNEFEVSFCLFLFCFSFCYSTYCL